MTPVNRVVATALAGLILSVPAAYAQNATAEAWRQRLSIRTPSIDLPIAKLSGGNQQKVMLSKWLNTRPSLLIVDEPTRGVDVGAKAEVHAIISELASRLANLRS